MNIYTNLLFSVAFSCFCWRPGEPDPAGGDQHQLCPSNEELWLLHHLQANLFLTCGILFPLSLDQTIRETEKHSEWQFMTDFKFTIIHTETNIWVGRFPTSGSRSSSIDSVSSLISGSSRDAPAIPRAACSSLSVIPVVSMQNPIWISGQDDSETQLC